MSQAQDSTVKFRLFDNMVRVLVLILSLIFEASILDRHLSMTAQNVILAAPIIAAIFSCVMSRYNRTVLETRFNRGFIFLAGMACNAMGMWMAITVARDYPLWQGWDVAATLGMGMGVALLAQLVFHNLRELIDAFLSPRP